jgi:hypothetical protein
MRFAEDFGYRIAEKSRWNFALGSFLLDYNETSGNKNHIQREMNHQNTESAEH